MSPLRRLPLKYRIPLIEGGLSVLSGLRGLARCKAPPPGGDIRGPLVVSGFFGEVLGIGRAGDLTADALGAAGLNPRRVQLRPAFRRLLDLHRPAVEARPGGVWIIHANAPETEIALMVHPPRMWSTRYRIGYWAWETPEAPAHWVRPARWMHEIWTPSRFVADSLQAAFDRAGETELGARLRVMPHPVEAPDIGPDREGFGLEDGVCYALTSFDGRSSFARKNPWAAIEAWRRAFPEPAQNARLLVRAVQIDVDPASARDLRELAAQRPDIVLSTRPLNRARMWRLLASVDFVVSLHRSEGFGLVPAEAMAMGRPAVATGWSATGEYIDDTCGAPVSYDLIPVEDASGRYRGDLFWADPHVDAAARAIRRLTEDHALRERLGQAARIKAREFTAPWAADAPLIRNIAARIG
ncbi:glycosyltransferase family 4 protein [Brevundimonas sp. 2R-24]|uniref:Glycosyltransferase family 4 protein n=1 Tax=Peiella sedimenti TaxID=3061083 RepID=A0ABT8SH49_9CAUL|nr:glycosyltransferase family 4 protein [Caulobacteraceae bacterium XZ-24]